MVLFKSCPRCSGDQVLRGDLYGQYITCLGCGYVMYPDREMETKPVVALRNRKTA